MDSKAVLQKCHQILTYTNFAHVITVIKTNNTLVVSLRHIWREYLIDSPCDSYFADLYVHH